MPYIRNIFRPWAKLMVCSITKKPWQNDVKAAKMVVVSRVTAVFVILSVTLGYLVLDKAFPAGKQVWGIIFLIITLNLYGIMWWRIYRVVKYSVRMREKQK